VSVLSERAIGVERVVVIVEAVERAQALFLSYLQPSQEPSTGEIVLAIETSLRRWGPAGCAAAAAAEYGEHPESAVPRMRWALSVTSARLEPVAA
jgi:hypothetical protein